MEGRRTVRLLVLTDRAQARQDLLDVTRAAIERGATGILLREKDLPRHRRAELARAILAQLDEAAPQDARPAAPTAPPGGPGADAAEADRWMPPEPAVVHRRTGLIVASDVELALQVSAAGVHLAANDPWPGEALQGVGGGRAGSLGGLPERKLLVGRSCHDETELLAARDEGADYVTLSPIFATASKPGYGPELGVEMLARLCRQVPDLPVIALGGIGPNRVAPCLAAGAAGVAVMGEMMCAADPRALATTLLREAGAGVPQFVDIRTTGCGA